MDIKRLAPEAIITQSIMRFSVNSELLIEVVEDGALVFDLSSGATTLINQNALSMVDTIGSLGKVAESDLEAIYGLLGADGFELSSVLASLEKTRLIFRC